MKFRVAPHAGAIAVALLTCSCATGNYSPAGLSTGATEGDVTRAMGKPTAQYMLPGAGKRLEFMRGPFGKHTFMLDFDSSGRLVSESQVLDEKHFNDLRTGISRDDVLSTIGHPSQQSALPYQRRTLWSYRYETPFCQWFQVSLDAAEKVVETGYGPDPLCIAKDVHS